MWTPATRRRHSREYLRYASDVSDEEWALLEPHLPAPCLTGRPRAWPMREIVNAIFYVLRSGCAWRLLPDSFPPRQTVYGWFLRLRDDCVLERLNHHLVMLDRARSGRAASPSAGALTAKASRRRRPAAEGLRRGSGLPAPHPSPSKSSGANPIRSASPFNPGVGSSSASSPGSIETGGSQKTSKLPSPLPRPSSTLPPSCCDPHGSRNQDEFRVGL